MDELILFIHSSTDGHVCFFHFSTIVNRAAVQVGYNFVVVKHLFSFFLFSFLSFFLSFFFFFVFLAFLGLHPWHMEVPKIGVKSEP